MKSSQNYPTLALRIIRRHQLANIIRSFVLENLEGFSSTLSQSLGPADWSCDPKIFGFEIETGLGIEHQLEMHLNQKSRLDFLLGDHWDVLPIASGSGFRVILTLILRIDISSGQLLLSGHAVLCDREFEKENYREICLQYFREINSSGISRRSPLPSTSRCATASPEWDSFDNKTWPEIQSTFVPVG